MGFVEAVSACFSKYATFSGRARRSEYWWFALFQALVNIAVYGIGQEAGGGLLGNLIELALVLPALAVAVRRLHDIDRSGWWLLIGIIPVIGWIMLLIWACTQGTLGPNRFGPDPLGPRYGMPG
ncbi:MAG: DUF805 domain-containing protein [Proteobacteria bacterium]|nr:DUF805 domain-containing protein [Pseudomonadota bacterium]